MGRPKLHDDRMRAELLRAAEALVARGGAEALSVRRLADAVGTTTRAVYSVFGSKDGVFEALYRESFSVLMQTVDAVPLTRRPALDLVRAGTDGFRRYVGEHPNLFRLVFERIVPAARPGSDEVAVGLKARQQLRNRVARLVDDGLARRDVELLTTAFHAECQGLASMELQGWFRGPEPPEDVWARSLAAVVRGFLSGGARMGRHPGATRRGRR